MTVAQALERGRRMSRRTIPIAKRLLFVLISLAPLPVMANVYECTGPGGDRVFTDDPQSFVNCTQLAIETVPKPPKDPHNSERPSPVKEPPSGLASPGAAVEESRSPDPSPPRSDPTSPTDPEYAPLPRVVTPDTQTCAKGINRLNPFGSAPCQPRAGSPPVSVPYEDYYR